MADSALKRSISEEARTVPVVGLPLAMAVITGIFLLLSLPSNGIRIYVNLSRRAVGLDDGLVVFSQLAFVAVFGTTVKASLAGLGTMNDGLNTFLMMEAQKWYFMWIVAYLWAMVTLKTAVCVTLLRILPPTQRKIRISVWILLSFCWLAWAVDFLAVLLLCRPIEASWNTALLTEGKAECGSPDVLIVISHLLTAASVTTDIGCTVLPGIMLWKTQIHTTSKLEIFALLSIASIASIATIIRAPYFTHYSNPEDSLSYWCGYMVLYSNIETGIGLFASSLPSVRRFYHIFKPEDESPQGSNSNSHALVTFGGSGRPAKGLSSRRDHDVMTATDGAMDQVYHPGEWEHLTDEGSDKGILINTEASGSDFEGCSKTQIRVDHSFEVTSHSISSRQL